MSLSGALSSAISALSAQSQALAVISDNIGSSSSDTLVPIDTSIAATSGSATTTTTVAANLPADAAINATFTSSMSVYDSLGTANTVQVTWTKTAENNWSASFGNPTLSSDSTQTTGTTSGSIAVVFNSDG